MKTIIRVNHFKHTGKWYGQKIRELKPPHINKLGYELVELFELNDESIQCYSDVSSGFSGPDFYHTIEVVYPDDVSNFCCFLIDNTKGDK